MKSLLEKQKTANKQELFIKLEVRRIQFSI